MRCLALVIGIDNYEEYDKLNSAVKDANDISKALKKLKFEVTLLTDCTYQDANEAVYNLGFEISEGCDVVVLYYAGHGEMINGSDCLLMKDAPFFKKNGDARPKSKSLIVGNCPIRSLG